MKTLKILGITLMLTVMMCVPAFAAGNGLVAGADGAYYLNGAKIVSQWVDCGTYYGYAGADGKVLSNLSISKAVVGEKGAVLSVDQMKGAVANPAPVAVVMAPVVNPVVTDPVYNMALIGSLDSLTQLQRANLEDRYFQRHYFNAYYEQYDAESHKAYCACGEWAFGAHSFASYKDYEKCTLCDQSRK